MTELDKMNQELDDIIATIYRRKMDIQQDKQQFVSNSGADLSTARQVRQQQAADRKQQALSMLSEGLSVGDIADNLDVTERTVKRYLNGQVTK